MPAVVRIAPGAAVAEAGPALHRRSHPLLPHPSRLPLCRRPRPHLHRPPPPAPVAPVAVVDPVEAAVLAVVAAQTGYPTDMLDLDLDLEADLGIDTVKQAETFAAIRAQYDIPRDDNLALRDYPTLRAVIGFVHDKAPNLPAAPAVVPAARSGSPRRWSRSRRRAPAPAVDPVEAAVLAVVAAQTGYPTDMLDLDLDLEADLGIDTVKQAETFAAIRAQYDIPRDDNLALRDYPTLRAVIGFVHDKAPNLPAAPAPAGSYRQLLRHPRLWSRSRRRRRRCGGSGGGCGAGGGGGADRVSDGHVGPGSGSRG